MQKIGRQTNPTPRHPKSVSGGAVKNKAPGPTPSQGGARPFMSNTVQGVIGFRV